MRPAALAIAFLVLLAGCTAKPSPASSGSDPSTGLLRGLVVDEAVRPLANVNVTVSGAGTAARSMLTDEKGLFNFTGLAPGSYGIAARKLGYIAVQSRGEVVAAVAEPPLVQVLLAAQAGQAPYVNGVKWEGYIGCAFAYGNLCSVPAQLGYDVAGDSSAHLFWSELTSEARVPDLVQVEAVWEAVLPTSQELSIIHGYSEPTNWAQLNYDGRFAVVPTTSPSFYRINQTAAASAKLGLTEGLVIEFYSGGYSPDFSRPPTGLTLNQPVRLFFHDFYGYLPPDGWRFVADGAPPPPT